MNGKVTIAQANTDQTLFTADNAYKLEWICVSNTHATSSADITISQDNFIIFQKTILPLKSFAYGVEGLVLNTEVVKAKSSIVGTVIGYLLSPAESSNGDMLAANNLSDLTNASTARTNLSLGNVNNTSDANKPISTATQTALNLGAPIASPTFTGTVTLPASTSLTTPVIGVATGTSLAVTGLITSSSATAGIGYATGSGGAVTQATSRTTGVTLNKTSGAITTNNTSLAAGAEAEFTVTDSSVAVGDVVVVAARSGQTAGTSFPYVSGVAAGSFKITLSNLHATTADTGAMIINFVVIKAVSA